jgi:hypothetical protein
VAPTLNDGSGSQGGRNHACGENPPSRSLYKLATSDELNASRDSMPCRHRVACNSHGSTGHGSTSHGSTGHGSTGHGSTSKLQGQLWHLRQNQKKCSD